MNLLRQYASSSRLSRSPCRCSRHYRFYTSQNATAYANPGLNSPSNPEPSAPGPNSIPISERGKPNTIGESLEAPHNRDTPKDIKAFRNPLEPTRVDLYLASIHAAGLEPTLDDIERCRPANHAPAESPRYADEYHNLVDTLCRSFSKEQLRHFGELYKLDSIWTRNSRRKIEYAESIIEKQWQWPSLKEIERKRRDRTEITVKTFFVNPSQLFLILGKDGADLLQLSMQYNVHISLESNPLALRVEGLRGALKELAEHMSSLKKGIIEEIAELPTNRPIRQDLIQRISRLAGAYVENLGYKGKVRICAKDSLSLNTAKRLAIRASSEVAGNSTPSILCYAPCEVKNFAPVPISMFPDTYSVYPFVSPRSLPWTMTAGGTFRIRRVGEWLGADTYENICKTGGLAAGEGRIMDKAQVSQDLSQAFSQNPPEPNHQRVIIASLGHSLLSSATPAQRTSLFPPLKGYWPLLKILNWLKESNMRTTFVPSLPNLLLNSCPTKQAVHHRLIYKTLSSTMNSDDSTPNPEALLKFEIEVSPSTTTIKSKPVPNDVFYETAMNPLDAFKYSLTGCQPPTSEGLSEQRSSGDKLIPPEVPLASAKSKCLEGTQSTLDLLMPDRPMDIQFSVFDYTELPKVHQPVELQHYATQLSEFLIATERVLTQPQPPITLHHQGKSYLLHSSLSVRKSAETISLGNPSGDEADCHNHENAEVVTESILDLESNQKSTICQVICDAHTNEDSWKRFLMSCDHLSSAVFRTGKVGADIRYAE
ncbi:hypothetical protein BJ138DRAFT_1062086 [Hygrophoropsis aurantiaca]|uniref:Uncharacterized protein n=1 Tax=Hygrophoropsis aurantiaca TaxID=72124 RepID=A0ACB8AF61_9AGAM|nr:hypothetical protein BJ138DRAFT_1062086 [Hygrophoropsis aurantiaca]